MASAFVEEAERQLDEQLAAVSERLDWHDPRIAFYGETNAGKSAVIEALRLFFHAHNDVPGLTIGTGKPDFTREARSYSCEHQGLRFDLIDVPGIEGDEAQVTTEIQAAIDSAHLVFLVTAEPKPPHVSSGRWHQGRRRDGEEPVPQRVKVFFDGGYCGNPATMEAAVVVAGRTTVLRDLGPGTSSDAEWLALIEAMTLARSLELRDFVLIGDSADVIAKAKGVLRCRGDDLPYLDRFRALAVSGSPPRIRQIKRSQNLAGIALARLHPR